MLSQAIKLFNPEVMELVAIGNSFRSPLLYFSSLFSVNPYFGSEIKFKEIIDFRFGIGDVRSEIDFNEEKYISLQPNLGIGFHFDNLYIDYALTNLGDFSSSMYSNLFSLRYTLK